MYKLAGKLSEVRMMAESHSSNTDSQEKNTLTATTDVRLAFGVPLDEVVNGGAAVDFEGMQFPSYRNCTATVGS